MISLIVATVGRVEELDRMLASMAAQALEAVEIIVVDQNTDDRVEALLAGWKGRLRFVHVRTARGLSRARNAGLRLASGELVGFPDDDCWYPESLLLQVEEWFERHPGYDLLSCSVQDGSGREVASRWPRQSQQITRDSVLRTCVSAALFMRKAALINLGGFDEQMGLGAATPFQSGEDSDVALRCLNSGSIGWFEKRLFVYHPDKSAGTVTSSRAFSYGMGFGRLLRVHSYSASTLLYHVARAVGGAAKSLLIARPESALFYWQSALGRLQGYLNPDPGIFSGVIDEALEGRDLAVGKPSLREQ